MSSENNAPPTITPRLTVPRPDTDASARSGAASPSRHGEADGTSSNGPSQKGASNGSLAAPLARDGAWSVEDGDRLEDLSLRPSNHHLLM